MAKTIRVDSTSNFKFTVSDAEYASIDWGASIDDSVRFVDEDGREFNINYSKVGSITIEGGNPPPGSYPGWRVCAYSEYGGVDIHVGQATKDALSAILGAAGSEDVILEFTATSGDVIKLPTANKCGIVLVPEDLVVPE